MGESKVRSINDIEQRAALKQAQQRRSRIRDRFGRGIEVGDQVILTEAMPTEVLWQVLEIVPATDPRLPPGATIMRCLSQTQILFVPGQPPVSVMLVIPGAAGHDNQQGNQQGNQPNDQQDNQPDDQPDAANASTTAREEPERRAPQPARTPSGLYVSPDDKPRESRR